VLWSVLSITLALFDSFQHSGLCHIDTVLTQCLVLSSLPPLFHHEANTVCSTSLSLYSILPPFLSLPLALVWADHIISIQLVKILHEAL
jgi:hypothetical protein